jgi:cell pole-organizing protein PopZ
MSSEDKKVEEILSSIRTIISEDMKEGNAPSFTRAPTATPSKPFDPVIELTQMVKEDGSIINLKEPASTPVSQSPTLRSPAFHENTPGFSSQKEGPRLNEELISTRAAEEFTKAFHSLENTIKNPNPSTDACTTTRASTDLGQMTLEGIVHQMLQPLLKDWLDRHLPSLVKLLVSEQIEKILKNKQQ